MTDKITGYVSKVREAIYPDEPSRKRNKQEKKKPPAGGCEFDKMLKEEMKIEENRTRRSSKNKMRTD